MDMLNDHLGTAASSLHLGKRNSSPHTGPHLDVGLQPYLKDMIVLGVGHSERFQGQLVSLDSAQVPKRSHRVRGQTG